MSRSVGGTASGRAVTWAWNLAHDPPPTAVRHAGARLILDALANALAGARSGTVDHLLAVSHRTAASGPATLFDGTGSVTVEDAALGNAVLIRCLDVDDWFEPGRAHVSSVVLAAVLAVAEQVDATGMDLLGSYLAGTELACRLARIAPTELRARGFDVTPVVGVGAAALAVGWLRGLHPGVARHAVGIAGAMAAGPATAPIGVDGPPSDAEWLLPAGLAARNAVLAADLAAAGATGPADVWEGPTGLFATYADVTVNADELVEGLGSRWHATDVSIRRYPSSPLTHGAVAAARSLSTDGVTPDDIGDLVVVVHPDTAGVVCRPVPAGQAATHRSPDAFGDPADPIEARRSVAWCVAATLVDGNLDPTSFDAQRIRRPDVLRLAERIRCEVTDRVHGPASTQPGHLRVRLVDGDEVVAMAPGGIGGPDHPVADEDLVQKFVGYGGDRHAAGEVARRILAVEDEPSVPELVGAVARLVR